MNKKNKKKTNIIELWSREGKRALQCRRSWRCSRIP